MATIKTVLTADSSELRAEYARAQQAVATYADVVANAHSAKRALWSAEQQALRLEASGQGAAAASLREKVSLMGQSKALAEQLNINEAAALRLLENRSALQKQIVANKQAEVAAAAKLSTFEKGLQQATAPAGNGSSRARRNADFDKQYDEAKAAVVSREQEKAAAAAARQRRIEQLPRGGADALPVLQLTPASLKMIDQATARTNELRRAALSAGAGGKTGALGFLAFSQAVEDAQYGMAGVINNVPQMVMGFGGSMGLAGGISLAVVGLYQFYKWGNKIIGNEGFDTWQKNATKAWNEYSQAIEHGSEALAKQERQEAARESIAQTLDREKQKLGELVKLDELRFKLIERQNEQVKSQREKFDELARAQQELAIERTPESSQQALRDQQAREASMLQSKRIAEDIASTQEQLTAAGQEYERVWNNIGPAVSDYQKKINAAQDALLTAKKQMVQDQPELSRIDQLLGSEKAKGDGSARRNEEKNREIVKVRILANEKIIEQTEAAIDLNRQLMDQAVNDNSVPALKDKIEALKKQRDALAENQKQAKQLLAVEEATRSEAKKNADLKATRGLKDFRSEIEALKLQAGGFNEKAKAIRNEIEARQQAIELAREYNITEAEGLKLAKEKIAARDAADQAEKEKERVGSRQELAMELKVLELKARGMDAQAKALQGEMDLRREAAELESKGFNKGEAVDLTKKRRFLLERVKEQEEQPKRRSKIRSYMGEERGRLTIPRLQMPYGGLGATHPLGSQAMRGEKAEDRRRGAALAERSKQDAAAKYWDRNLNLQEQMLNIFKSIGAV